MREQIRRVLCKPSVLLPCGETCSVTRCQQGWAQLVLLSVMQANSPPVLLPTCKKRSRRHCNNAPQVLLQGSSPHTLTAGLQQCLWELLCTFVPLY